MAKAAKLFDVLVLGEHPSASLAAALLAHDRKLRVALATIPTEAVPDRLVLLNPALFRLHALLKPLQRRIDTHALYGVQFLSDDPAIRSEHRARSAIAQVASYRHVRDALRAVAGKQGVELMAPKAMRLHGVDETGADLTLGNTVVRARAIILAGQLDEAHRRLLAIPDTWEPGVLHRYSFVRLRQARWAGAGSRPVMPMSLDLGATLAWAWLIPAAQHTQLAVLQPIALLRSHPPSQLLSHWCDVLKRHGTLPADAAVPLDEMHTIDMPLAGALSQEGVADHTLLVGPAGGFFAASGEDIYPNCWSAIHAADVLKKALNERHLQDALQPYRYKWRTTLGEYLRGPQQNLRFLLPLIYRNQVMTTRLAEAVLLGKSVVR